MSEVIFFSHYYLTHPVSTPQLRFGLAKLATGTQFCELNSQVCIGASSDSKGPSPFPYLIPIYSILSCVLGTFPSPGLRQHSVLISVTLYGNCLFRYPYPSADSILKSQGLSKMSTQKMLFKYLNKTKVLLCYFERGNMGAGGAKEKHELNDIICVVKNMKLL